MVLELVHRYYLPPYHLPILKTGLLQPSIYQQTALALNLAVHKVAVAVQIIWLRLQGNCKQAGNPPVLREVLHTSYSTTPRRGELHIED